MKKAGIARKISNAQKLSTNIAAKEVRLKIARQKSISFFGANFDPSKGAIGAQNTIINANTLTLQPASSMDTLNFCATMGIIPIIPSSVLKIPNTPKHKIHNKNYDSSFSFSYKNKCEVKV